MENLLFNLSSSIFKFTHSTNLVTCIFSTRDQQGQGSVQEVGRKKQEGLFQLWCSSHYGQESELFQTDWGDMENPLFL